MDDSAIPQTLKDRIFKPATHPGWSYICTSNPNFNVNGKLIVIPVEFPSLPRNTAVTNLVIDEAFFSSGGFGNDNIRAYFEKNSYGQYTITKAAIAPWVTLSNDTSFYAAGMLGNDWTRNAQLSQDICQAAAINWASLDLNGDNSITATEAQIIFLYSDGGLGANRPSTVTIQAPGTYTISNKFCYLSCKSNSDPAKATDPIACNYVTIRHELMHGLFGLPDRYITTFGTTGNYDPMSANRPRWTVMNVIDKIKIGWLTPKILTYDGATNPAAPTSHQCYSFANSLHNKSALVLYNPTYPDECWVVENRCNNCATVANFDSGLPESGLAVWWMDLNTENIFLVEASKPPAKPPSYTAQNSGALHRYVTGKSSEFIPLYPDNGFPAFNFRMVSTPGSTMYVEFKKYL